LAPECRRCQEQGRQLRKLPQVVAYLLLGLVGVFLSLLILANLQEYCSILYHKTIFL
jgi:hypothetical protein